MQSEQQYEQLMLQYKQLKNGAADIARLIEKEDFDSAINLIKMREGIFISCKTIRRYLELTPEQQKEVDTIFNEIKELEEKNINTLEQNMEFVKSELSRTQKVQKLSKAYNTANPNGSILNLEN